MARPTAYRTLETQLKRLSGHQFQAACSDSLRIIWPDLVYAKDLGSTDQSGVDLWLPNATRGANAAIALQCKGFEVPTFAKDQLAQCIASIRKFAASDFAASEYILLINRPIIDRNLRDDLETALARLVETGKVERSIWLDAHGTTEMLLEGVRGQLLQAMRDRDVDHLSKYADWMDSSFYLDDVPFDYREAGQGGRNALEHLTANLTGRVKDLGSSNLPSRYWSFVVSEFGFGKTRLLLELGVRLWETELRALYMPLAALPRSASLNELEMADAILKHVLGEGYGEDSDEHRRLWVSAFRAILKSDPQFVLLLDGLDEMAEAYTLEGLERFFRCLGDFACSIVLSCRKEFWDAKAGDISEVIGPRKPALALVDWDDGTIGEYVKQELKRSESKSLRRLLNVVVTDKYRTYYGDIPKRPLFLKMIVDDVIGGTVEERFLSELYATYLQRKMSFDPRTAFGHTGRQLPDSTLDLFDFQRRMLAMMRAVALNSVEYAGDEGWLRDTFGEGEVLAAAKGVSLPSLGVTPYLMHGVLVPSGPRGSEELSIRFAHKSFHGFFVAEGLVELLERDEPEAKSRWNSSYPEEVRQFVVGSLQALNRRDAGRATQLVSRVKSWTPLLPDSLAAEVLARN